MIGASISLTGTVETISDVGRDALRNGYKSPGADQVDF